MKLRAHGATHVGLVREGNEDSFIVDPAHGFFGVADGLGGLPGGEVASRTAVAVLEENLRRFAVGSRCDLAAWVAEAHRAVHQAGQGFGATGIATTLTCAQVAGDEVLIAHVGDSFAFLVRDGTCRAVTREHNVENERSDPLALAPFSAAHRFALTRVVGGPEPVRPDLFREKLRAGDRLLLATDGLTDLLEPEDIVRRCAENPEAVAAADALISEALRRGGHDNVTVVVVDVLA